MVFLHSLGNMSYKRLRETEYEELYNNNDDSEHRLRREGSGRGGSGEEDDQRFNNKKKQKLSSEQQEEQDNEDVVVVESDENAKQLAKSGLQFYLTELQEVVSSIRETTKQSVKVDEEMLAIYAVLRGRVDGWRRLTARQRSDPKLLELALTRMSPSDLVGECLDDEEFASNLPAFEYASVHCFVDFDPTDCLPQEFVVTSSDQVFWKVCDILKYRHEHRGADDHYVPFSSYDGHVLYENQLFWDFVQENGYPEHPQEEEILAHTRFIEFVRRYGTASVYMHTFPLNHPQSLPVFLELMRDAERFEINPDCLNLEEVFRFFRLSVLDVDEILDIVRSRTWLFKKLLKRRFKKEEGGNRYTGMSGRNLFEGKLLDPVLVENFTNILKALVFVTKQDAADPDKSNPSETPHFYARQTSPYTGSTTFCRAGVYRHEPRTHGQICSRLDDDTSAISYVCIIKRRVYVIGLARKRVSGLPRAPR